MLITLRPGRYGFIFHLAHICDAFRKVMGGRACLTFQTVVALAHPVTEVAAIVAVRHCGSFDPPRVDDKWMRSGRHLAEPRNKDRFYSPARRDLALLGGGGPPLACANRGVKHCPLLRYSL
jgi:hypothetical protein